jgi:hypothetical protein
MKIDFEHVGVPTVADALEFDSWPEEQQQLALRVLQDKLDGDVAAAYDRGYNDGLGKDLGC